MQPTPGGLGWAETASNWKAPNFESFFQESLDTHLPSRLQQSDELQHPVATAASPADVKSEAGRCGYVTSPFTHFHVPQHLSTLKISKQPAGRCERLRWLLRLIGPSLCRCCVRRLAIHLRCGQALACVGLVTSAAIAAQGVARG